MSVNEHYVAQKTRHAISQLTASVLNGLETRIAALEASDVVVIPLSVRANQSHTTAGGDQMGGTINKTGRVLAVLGVTVSTGQTSSGSPDEIDVKVAGTSILAAAMELDTSGAIVSGTLSGTPTIAVDAEITLWVHTHNNNHSWHVNIYCR